MTKKDIECAFVNSYVHVNIYQQFTVGCFFFFVFNPIEKPIRKNCKRNTQTKNHTQRPIIQPVVD